MWSWGGQAERYALQYAVAGLKEDRDLLEAVKQSRYSAVCSCRAEGGPRCGHGAVKQSGYACVCRCRAEGDPAVVMEAVKQSRGYALQYVGAGLRRTAMGRGGQKKAVAAGSLEYGCRAEGGPRCGQGGQAEPRARSSMRVPG